ncbi:unnamed protein product [Cercospora beticola]|nr:unnamed protein product [Cercospora beticola]
MQVTDCTVVGPEILTMMLARRVRYDRHIIRYREYPSVPTSPRPNLCTITNAKMNAWGRSKHIPTLSVARFDSCSFLSGNGPLEESKVVNSHFITLLRRQPNRRPTTNH